MTPILLVFTTVPDRSRAGEIADDLVGRRLAACCTIVDGATSIYRWEGMTERSVECQMIIKTTREAFPALRDRIVKLHPYDLPEILAIPVETGLEAYIAWVGTEVSETSRQMPTAPPSPATERASSSPSDETRE